MPWWETLAGLVALALFAYGFVLLAARLFRAENVLSTRALTWTRLRGGAAAEARARARGRRGRRGAAGAARGNARVRGGASGRRSVAVCRSRREVLEATPLPLLLGAAAVLVAFGVIEYARARTSASSSRPWESWRRSRATGAGGSHSAGGAGHRAVDWPA